MTRDILLIDLDDTLYPERDYVMSGFQAVANHIRLKYELSDTLIIDQMIDIVDTQGRGDVFNQILDTHKIAYSKETIVELVDLYRNHTPKNLSLYDGVLDSVKELKKDYRIAIVTDGLAIMQKAKVAALGIDRYVDAIIYCWEEDAPKPSAAGFEKAIDILGGKPEQCLIIGDNPVNDGTPAKALSIPFIQVMSGAHQPRDNQTIQISDFNQVAGLLHSEKFS